MKDGRYLSAHLKEASLLLWGIVWYLLRIFDHSGQTVRLYSLIRLKTYQKLFMCRDSSGEDTSVAVQR